MIFLYKAAKNIYLRQILKIKKLSLYSLIFISLYWRPKVTFPLYVKSVPTCIQQGEACAHERVAKI